MKRLFLAVSLLAAGLQAGAQTVMKFTVVNREGERVPYASAYIPSGNSGVAGDISGNISLGTTGRDDTIIFAAPGYAPLRIAAGQTSPDGMVTLQAQPPVPLQGEWVAPLHPDKYPLVRSSLESSGFYGFLAWTTVVVKVVEQDMTGKVIEAVEAEIQAADIKAKDFPYLVRLKITLIGPDGLPGDDYLRRTVAVEPVKVGKNIISNKHKLRVDISDLKLTMPFDGLYVGFEWLPRIQDIDQTPAAKSQRWPILALSDKYPRYDLTLIRKGDGKWMTFREYIADKYTDERHRETMERYNNVKIGVRYPREPRPDRAAQ